MPSPTDPRTPSDRKPSKTTRKNGGEPELQEFFDRFTRALIGGDGKAAAEMWETPAYFIGDEMIRAEEDPVEVEKFFGSAKEMYASKGIRRTRAELGPVQWVTERIAEVDVRFPWLDADGNERGEESSRYTLRRGDDGALRLCVAVMRGEQ
ncbi:MAG: hypothetical protein H6Q89_1215 [Myxococcaceae bacterium]|nr:hypothetical protein [Myxococcaceae bacterium]